MKVSKCWKPFKTLAEKSLHNNYLTIQTQIDNKTYPASTSLIPIMVPLPSITSDICKRRKKHTSTYAIISITNTTKNNFINPIQLFREKRSTCSSLLLRRQDKNDILYFFIHSMLKKQCHKNKHNS